MILVCAATRSEAAACRRGIADAGAAGFEVLTTGVGLARAATALRRRLRDGVAGRSSSLEPTLVVSSGFAGTPSAEIEQLTWITASSVHRLVDGRTQPVDVPRGLLHLAGGATVCHVVSADHVVPGDACGMPHPAAVDMESAALAEVAAAAAIPFSVLRLVTDTPARPLASLGRTLAAALAADGLAGRVAQGSRAALELARSPAGTIAFVRESLTWCERLRDGWRDHARRGVPSSPAE